MNVNLETEMDFKNLTAREIKSESWYEKKCDMKDTGIKKEDNFKSYIEPYLKAPGKLKSEIITNRNSCGNAGCFVKREDIKIEAEAENVSYEQKYFDLIDKIKYETKPEWIPPRSPHNLVEEALYHDPWALLVATIFLNKTSCSNARPHIFWFLYENPLPSIVLMKLPEDLLKYFLYLGLQNTRAHQVWRMTKEYVLNNWRNVTELYGIGRYGSDAYKMFCLGDFNVEPNDRFLRIYKAWYETIGKTMNESACP